MKVLLIPSSYPTRRENWQGNYVHEFSRSLALGHDVTVVYPQQLGRPGVGDEPFFTDELLGPRIRLVNYTYPHLAKTWMLSYLGAFKKVWRRLRREWRPDVVFAHIVMPAGPAALLAGRLLGVPVILTEHWGPAGDWLKEPPVPRGLMRAVVENTYRRVDYLTAVSDSLAGEIEAVYGASADGKLDYPIDCEVFRPDGAGAAGGPRRVLCVTRGHFDPRKGVPNLLAAWEMVARRTNGSAVLDVIGPDVELLAPRVAELGLGGTVNLLPWVPAPELASLMRRSALVVIPSVYETFGRSGAEALACGVPVVATDCGGPREYVGEGTGLLVPKEEPAALAEAVLAGLRRENFLPPEELARRTRERFAHEVICRRFTEVAEGLLGKKMKKVKNQPGATTSR
jgi:glycosyltransferase involved in cell wall biosynthesis